MTEEARKKMFRLSSVKFEAIENELYIWIDALRRSKIEVPPSLAIMKAKEIAQKLNIKEEEFKASWQWLASFRRRRGLKSMHLFGEVDKDDPVLLQQLEDLYSVIKMYRPENVYNMDETGLCFAYCLDILC
ncbi:jerky protein-like [Hydra vulgaris]|uniref:Jerky protein-like n=1 Tax=Hydra vulgaris TaxID=6087 RepID=A0ABM4D1N1_HYDVU